MKLPLAEHFHSIQGEGHWVGTPMHFIRLAGCNVGRLQSAGKAPILPSGKSAWECKRFDGTPFWCDTDFNKYQEVEIEDLVTQTWEKHICVTGGEPLLHKEALELIGLHTGTFFVEYPIKVHIETSGTIYWKKPDWVWLTVSPKLGCDEGMLKQADEIKLLVDPSLKDLGFSDLILTHPRVFLSPINHVDMRVLPDENPNLKEAMELLRQYPHWRLSVQLHKYLGVR